jgi:hypothetical protein
MSLQSLYALERKINFVVSCPSLFIHPFGSSVIHFRLCTSVVQTSISPYLYTIDRLESTRYVFLFSSGPDSFQWDSSTTSSPPRMAPRQLSISTRKGQRWRLTHFNISTSARATRSPIPAGLHWTMASAQSMISNTKSF